MSIPTILIVDDLELFLTLEKGYLKETKANIITAENGRQALDLIKQSRPDLIFMDFVMPEMDGAECCRQLKLSSSTRTIPVVMVCDGMRREHQDKCRAAGCDALLAKPISRKDFLETGHRFLADIERRQARIQCNTTAFFRTQEESFYGAVIDISPGGLFISCDQPLVLGEVLEVGFVLPGFPSDVIEAKAKVAWVNQKSTKIKESYPLGFGVQFLSISDPFCRIIEAYIKNQV